MDLTLLYITISLIFFIASLPCFLCTTLYEHLQNPLLLLPEIYLELRFTLFGLFGWKSTPIYGFTRYIPNA
jgi:hypothetical protein